MMLAKRLVLLSVILAGSPAQAFEVKPGLWKFEQVGGQESPGDWSTEFCRDANYTGDYSGSFRDYLKYAGFEIEEFDDDGDTVHMTVADRSLNPPLVSDVTLEKHSDEHVVYTNDSREDGAEKFVEDQRWLSEDC